MLRRIAGLAAVFSLTSALQISAQQIRKLYISADMEGVVGTVTGDQLGPAGFEYARFREFMTEEVLAAIRAARAAGVEEILISDSHGNGENLLIERFPPDVQIVRSWPRPLMMMQGIDSSFDAAIFIGYHAGTHNPDGVRAHTMSSARITDVRLNGQQVPEAGINAAIAGHFGVPIIMVSGDDAAVAETQALLGDVEGAVVKWNYGFHSARTLTPAAAYDVIEEATRRALARTGDFRPWRLETPIIVDMSFKNYRVSEMLDYLTIVDRPDAHSIRYVGANIIEVSKFLEFVTTYSPDLSP